MDLGIRGKVALVTGASSGLGRAVALSLAREGARVCVAARRKALLDELTGMHAYAADLTDDESIGKLLAAVKADHGGADILVVNGGGPKPAAFTQLSLADWDTAYQLVLRGKLRLVQGALPDMRARKWGRIVALESVTVKEPLPNMALSNSLRVAMASALKTLAGEVAAEGITVNTIATGLIATARLDHLYDTPEKKAAAAAGSPMKRLATPEEFAPLVTFLCGAPASYITGQTISIDGGRTAGLFG
jgi:3-oxoacyl-[acyl-carrier protein] reductase